MYVTIQQTIQSTLFAPGSLCLLFLIFVVSIEMGFVFCLLLRILNQNSYNERERIFLPLGKNWNYYLMPMLSQCNVVSVIVLLAFEIKYEDEIRTNGSNVQKMEEKSCLYSSHSSSSHFCFSNMFSCRTSSVDTPHGIFFIALWRTKHVSWQWYQCEFTYEIIFF